MLAVLVKMEKKTRWHLSVLMKWGKTCRLVAFFIKLMAKKTRGLLAYQCNGKIHLGLMYTKQLVGCLAHEPVKWAKKLVDFAILTK